MTGHDGDEMPLSTEPPWFAFLIHPRNLADLMAWKGSSLLRRYSSSDEEFVAKATTMESAVVGDLLFGLGGPRGELVGVVRMPRQVLTGAGRSAIAEAVRFAASRGAKVVGLGALTAPATHAGADLLADLPDGVTLTTGNAYTAAVAQTNVDEAVRYLDLSRRARVAVLGATGSVGAPAARLLVQDGHDVTLLGRSLRRVHDALGDLAGHARSSDSLEDLRQADVVVVVTSGASALVGPEHVQPGAVVVDMTQPSNIDQTAYDAFRANGVHVVAGGGVRIPGYRTTYELPTGGPTHTFACLAETYLMAREGIREHSVGVPSVEFALRMRRVAARHGVVASPLELQPGAVAHPGAQTPQDSQTPQTSSRGRPVPIGAGRSTLPAVPAPAVSAPKEIA